MSETFQLKLPLIQAGQAQKHVTVNESLARLDALTQKVVVSRNLTNPPTDAVDGQAYLVPTSASSAWLGFERSLAIFTNGGWVFVQPKNGWRLWVSDEDAEIQLVAGTWILLDQLATAGGAKTNNLIAELDHTLVAGTSNVTVNIIPKYASVLGITARVTTAITAGASTGWSLGVPGFFDRYGSGYGMAQNSYAVGMTGQPQTYWDDTALELTADGGDFVSGVVKLAVHYTLLSPPNTV